MDNSTKEPYGTYMELTQNLKEQAKEAIRNLNGTERAPVSGPIEITRAGSALAEKLHQQKDDGSVTILSTFTPENNGEYLLFIEKTQKEE